MNKRFSNRDSSRMVRFAFMFAGLIGCVFGISSALRIGQARSLVNDSLSTGSVAAASEAVRLSPHDPEAYAARAVSLTKREELGLALEDLRRSIALRPLDYRLWAELGTGLDRMGETKVALAALAEARTLAPFYAEPHWNTAQLLQKLSQRDEAFKEFRSATLTEPRLFTKVIEIAWEAYSGNCEAVQRAVDPRTPQETLAVAHFFVRNGKATEALSLIRLVNRLRYPERRQFVIEFLEAKKFTEAHELWVGMRQGDSGVPIAGSVDDGGFETGRLSDEPGFSWRVNEIRGTKLSMDQGIHREGARSLRIDWHGTPDTSEEVVSQLVLVEPNTRYQLNLVTRAQELVTSGAPVVTVTDASQSDSQRLAQSSTLPLGTSDWQNIRADFTTTNATRAVRIGIQRQRCQEQPCPIFGVLWLDDFALVHISEDQTPHSSVSQEQHVSDN
ncbi:MAG: hypothetical protein ND895_27230 [Pyrinomonadaceae bacterium]|nr:hypothetical protein [Pyrinomonadaceae bacterium]